MAHVERKPGGIMAWLRAEAATGRALRAADLATDRWSTTAVSKALFYLDAAGYLHRAKLDFKQVYYCDTRERAQAFVAAERPKYLAAKLAADMAHQAAKAEASKRQRPALAALPAAPNSTHAPADAAPPAAAVQPARPIAYTYGPSFTSGPLSGHCPPDRPPVLRAGALDYRRHMAKHQQGSAA